MSTTEERLKLAEAEVARLQSILMSTTHSCCDCCCEVHLGDMLMVCPKCAGEREAMASVIEAAEAYMADESGVTQERDGSFYALQAALLNCKESKQKESTR